MSLPSSTNLTVLSVLKAGEWFRGLEQSLLEQLARRSVIRNFSEGETLFQRGDRGNFYMVLSSVALESRPNLRMVKGCH